MDLEKNKIFAIITIISTIFSLGLGVQQVVAYFEDQANSTFEQLSIRIDKDKEFLKQCNFSEAGTKLVEPMITTAEKELFLSDRENIDYDLIKNQLWKAENYIVSCTDPCPNEKCPENGISYSLGVVGVAGGPLLLLPVIFLIIAIVFAIKWKKSKKIKLNHKNNKI